MQACKATRSRRIIAIMKIVCAIVALGMSVVTASAGSGFDSIDCDPQSFNRVRAGRARLISTIPCDLTKQSYCNIPGEAYPWNAMKRFVYENQGLVRRMYGDIRHIFVMQSEIENEVDSDDFKHHADKYSKAFNNQHEQQRKTREMKIKKISGEKKNFRSDTEPHFRPLNKSSRPTRTPKPPTNEQQPQPDTEINSGKIVLIHKLPQEAPTDDKVIENATTNASTTRITTSTSSIIASTSTEESIAVNISTSATLSSSETSSSAPETTKIIDSLQETSEVAPLLQSDASTTSTSSSTSASNVEPSTSASIVSSSTEPEPEIEKVDESGDAIAQESIQVEETIEVFDDLRSVFSSDIVKPNNSASVRPTFSRVPPPVPHPASTTTTTTEAQLFQDSIFSKDKEPPPAPVNRRGVNACPVKEEVVAPFWGNNTRGEILALLNVYPYEQYINWEKCTNEHEQMMCRRGCKCEQQYRLHRLLAYNPLDACRGIFSDWFRFPSCCICKCYDIPFDFRVTSRSPRGADKLMDGEDDDEIDDSEGSFRNYEEDFDDRIDETDINREESNPQNLERPLQ